MRIKDRTDEWDLFDRLVVFKYESNDGSIREVDLTNTFWIILSGLLAWGIWWL